MAPNEFSRLGTWVRQSVTLRILSIAFLIIILLIPLTLIQGLIRDREYRLEQATTDVSSTWSNAQQFAGPYITIPYVVLLETTDGEIHEQTRHLYLLPDSLIITGTVSPEIRHRGIYQVTVYRGDLHISGRFSPPQPELLNIDRSSLRWNEASMSVGIPDLRGIAERVNLQFGDTMQPFEPGLPTHDLHESGISTHLPISQEWRGPIDYSFDLMLKGSGRISFIPTGIETRVGLSADWPSPSFDGSFLPDSRNVTDEGFDATWRVLQLNRDYPRQWIGASYALNRYDFGVTLLLPVDHYRKSRRSADYALLIISLTFLVFFFLEIRQRKRVHPLQYLLVGLALALFYALVLALSEHWNFAGAYISAAVATIALVTGYVGAVFKTRELTIILGGLLVLLFGFNYVLLQLEDYALLVGSIGLFLVLAFVMMWSRNIDWYRLSEDPDDDSF